MIPRADLGIFYGYPADKPNQLVLYQKLEIVGGDPALWCNKGIDKL
jgi:hypothetical protein